MAFWPGTIPQWPLREGLSFGQANGLLSTQVDQGVPKVRRKTTVTYRPMECVYIMATSHRVIFENFIKVDLAGGALSFGMPDPANYPNPCTARFNPERLPEYAPEDVGFWLVRCSFLVLPP